MFKNIQAKTGKNCWKKLKCTIQNHGMCFSCKIKCKVQFALIIYHIFFNFTEIYFEPCRLGEISLKYIF